MFVCTSYKNGTCKIMDTADSSSESIQRSDLIGSGVDVFGLTKSYESDKSIMSYISSFSEYDLDVVEWHKNGLDAVIIGVGKDKGYKCAFVFEGGKLIGRCNFKEKHDNWDYQTFSYDRCIAYKDGWLIYGRVSYYDKHYYHEDKGENLESHCLYYKGKLVHSTAYMVGEGEEAPFSLSGNVLSFSTKKYDMQKLYAACSK